MTFAPAVLAPASDLGRSLALGACRSRCPTSRGSSPTGDGPRLLTAISCGAVFTCANTYIGNGPNFMVRAIAEEAGVRMPSFFGYMAYAGLVLLPLFVVVTLVFFR